MSNLETIEELQRNNLSTSSAPDLSLSLWQDMPVLKTRSQQVSAELPASSSPSDAPKAAAKNPSDKEQGSPDSSRRAGQSEKNNTEQVKETQSNLRQLAADLVADLVATQFSLGANRFAPVPVKEDGKPLNTPKQESKSPESPDAGNKAAPKTGSEKDPKTGSEKDPIKQSSSNLRDLASDVLVVSNAFATQYLLSKAAVPALRPAPRPPEQKENVEKK